MRAPERWSPSPYVDWLGEPIDEADPPKPNVEHRPDLVPPADPIGFTSSAHRLEALTHHGGEQRRGEVEQAALGKAGDRFDLRNHPKAKEPNR